MSNTILNQSIPVFLLLSVNALFTANITANTAIKPQKDIPIHQCVITTEFEQINDIDFLDTIMEKINLYLVKVQQFLVNFKNKESHTPYAECTETIQHLVKTIKDEIIKPLEEKAKIYGPTSSYSSAWKAVISIFGPLDAARHIIEMHNPKKNNPILTYVRAMSLGKQLTETQQALTQAIKNETLVHLEELQNRCEDNESFQANIAQLKKHLESFIATEGRNLFKAANDIYALKHRLEC